MTFKSVSLCCLASLCLIAATTDKPPIPPRAPSLSRIPGTPTLHTAVNLLLTWDYPAAELSPDVVFRVYHTTNITAVPISWSVIQSVTNATTATVSVEPGSHWFAVRTWSQFWQVESGPSEAATTPPAPKSITNLEMSRP